MPADLQAAGWQGHRTRIARFMRHAGLQARGRCRWRYTTQSAHAYPIAPNHLAQHCTVTAPDRGWVTDIPYVATDEGWVYGALVMDLFSRKLVGWALEHCVDTRLPLAALPMALGRRHPDASRMHHSDRGVQDAATAYRAVLESRGITLSLSRPGHCSDNAPMESATGTVKPERVSAQRYLTRAEAKADLIESIGSYNTDRRHSALGYRSPAEFERQWWSQRQPAEAPLHPQQGDTSGGIEGRSPVRGQL